MLMPGVIATCCDSRRRGADKRLAPEQRPIRNKSRLLIVICQVRGVAFNSEPESSETQGRLIAPVGSEHASLSKDARGAQLLPRGQGTHVSRQEG
jgi:hypothetical protein